MKGNGLYVVDYGKPFSSSLFMCNNSSKRFNGEIYKVFSQESEVNYFDLLTHEVNQASLLCNDLNQCDDLMSSDWKDYFNKDRAM